MERDELRFGRRFPCSEEMRDACSRPMVRAEVDSEQGS